MSRSRAHVFTHGVRLALFLLACFAAGRFLVRTVDRGGWTPGAFFGLLLVTGAVSLAWRAVLDLRKATRRRRG